MLKSFFLFTMSLKNNLILKNENKKYFAVLVRIARQYLKLLQNYYLTITFLFHLYSVYNNLLTLYYRIKKAILYFKMH
jgi:hypothetical protein